MRTSFCCLFTAALGVCLCLACSTRPPATSGKAPGTAPSPATAAKTPPPAAQPPVPAQPVATAGQPPRPVQPGVVVVQPPLPPQPPLPLKAPLTAPQPVSSPQAVVTPHPAPVVPKPANLPLPTSIMAWDSEMKNIEVHAGDAQGHLAFSFTNVSPDNVVILNVHPGCGCTSAQLPSLPWTNAPGANGRIGVTVNIARTAMPTKNLTVTTDKGIKVLYFHVNILPVVLPPLTDADRARDLQIAQTNRQAVLQGECVICHVKQGEGKYGQPLYDADCGICHDGPHRSDLVPDLHHLKVPTNLDFWRSGIAHGKPGSLMPAFAATDGGPLNDMQISLLAQYLNGLIPPRPAPPANPAITAPASPVPAAPAKTP